MFFIKVHTLLVYHYKYTNNVNFLLQFYGTDELQNQITNWKSIDSQI